MNATRKEKQKRLARVEAAYERALASIRQQPTGNGYATQAEMQQTVVELYLSTIMALRRQLGIY